MLSANWFHQEHTKEITLLIRSRRGLSSANMQTVLHPTFLFAYMYINDFAQNMIEYKKLFACSDDYSHNYYFNQ